MSNIFNSIPKYFGPQGFAVNPKVYQPRQQDISKGLIVLGYSVVYFDSNSQSRVNNFDNL